MLYTDMWQIIGDDFGLYSVTQSSLDNVLYDINHAFCSLQHANNRTPILQNVGQKQFQLVVTPHIH